MEKPAFDPSQPFESAKPQFDPSKPFDAAEAHEGEPTSPYLATLESFTNTPTLGYLPHLQAIVAPLVDKVMGQQTDDTYVERRDKNIKRQEAESKDHPYPSMVGTGLGIGASMLVPAGAVSKGASALKAIGLTGLTGAAQGLAQNPGDVEGVVDPLQLKERGRNAAVAGTISAALPGAGRLISSKINSASLSKAAEAVAFKGAGAMLKDFRAANNKGRVNEIGRFMLDRGLIKAGDTVEKVAEKSRALREQAGQKLDEIYSFAREKLSSPEVLKKIKTPEQAKALMGFSPVHDADELIADVAQSLKGDVNGRTAINRFKEYIAQLQEDYGPHLDIRTANDIKSKMDSAINYSKRANDLPEFQQALMTARKHISQKIDNQLQAMDQILSGSQAKALRETNKVYGNASTVFHVAEDRVQRESANRAISLSDYIGGGIMGAAGAAGSIAASSPVAGVASIALAGAGALANKTARKYGLGVLAQGLDKASRLKSPVDAAKMARAINLMRIDPEFKPQTLIDGFPENQLIEVPEEQKELYRGQITKDKTLSSIERAKRINLLNKHGKLPVE